MSPPPAPLRAPASTTSTRRPTVTTSLFGTSFSMQRAATPDNDGGEEHGSQERYSHLRSSPNQDSSEQRWTLSFTCKGAQGGQEFAVYQIGRDEITLGNLITLKSSLGYGTRDYLYYKSRSGAAAATLREIEFDDDANEMVQCNVEEREVRLVLSKNEIAEKNVEITPIKLPRTSAISEDSTDESFDEYKHWLEDMHRHQRGVEFKDIFREDTIKSYKEWLRMEGRLEDISAYDNPLPPQDLTNSSQDGNPTPPLQRPSHARRQTQRNDGQNSQKRKARGTLKGLTAATKRAKQGNQKLKVSFSRLGGAVGENARTFTDEIVLFTRRKAPLIGVATWRDIHPDVKDALVTEMMNKWDIRDTPDIKQKILTIANERYKGWRATFSATYRAYNTYDERMRHKPEDLDIIEWHYLVSYFSTDAFQRISSKNSGCRQNRKINPVTGSKSFSQLSYEKRDPLTGDEPNDIDLFAMTHCKNGEWSSAESKDVYDYASTQISERETNGDGNNISDVQQNQIFQTAYKVKRKSKSSKILGNGYMAKYPTRRHLLSEDYERQVRNDTSLAEAFSKLNERLESQESERETEREQHRAQLEAEREQHRAQLEAEREQHKREMEEMMKAREAAIKKEFMSLLQAAQEQGSFQQVNNDGHPIAAVASAPTTMVQANVTPPESQDNSQEQDNQNSVPRPQTPALAAAAATTIPTRTTRSSAATQNKGGNNVAFTTTKALKANASKKRSMLKKNQQAANTQEDDLQA